MIYSILNSYKVLSNFDYFILIRSSYPDHVEGEDEDESEEMETDVTPDALAAEGYELVLPSGTSAVKLPFLKLMSKGDVMA